MTEYPQVVLKPKEEGRLMAGHLWAFSNEVATAPKNFESGGVADLMHAKSGFLGRGFYNPHSLIAFRIVSDQKDETIDEEFFQKRLTAAMGLRSLIYPGINAYRWVFGESDRLPGLIIDRYGDYLSIQILAAGMERFKAVLIKAACEVAQPKGIIIRGDAALRTMDGLPAEDAYVAYGEVPERVQIETENGKFWVDPLGGQKTGFYFDQRDNRKALAAFCQGRKVLDAFCYSGGFGIAAALAGAREVVFTDTAEPALVLAEANTQLNPTKTQFTFVKGDAHQVLTRQSPGGPFDVISIDPPAFARNKKNLMVAMKAYEKLNSEAISALPRGGILASSSCSHHVSKEYFIEMLRKSARKARRNLRILEVRSQAKDHPVLLAMPETEYLKFAILQVL